MWILRAFGAGGLRPRVELTCPGCSSIRPEMPLMGRMKSCMKLCTAPQPESQRPVLGENVAMHWIMRQTEDVQILGGKRRIDIAVHRHEVGRDPLVGAVLPQQPSLHAQVAGRLLGE